MYGIPHRDISSCNAILYKFLQITPFGGLRFSQICLSGLLNMTLVVLHVLQKNNVDYKSIHNYDQFKTPDV